MVDQTYDVFVGTLYPLEACTIFLQLGSEILQSLLRLFGLGLDGLLPSKFSIVVNGTRECCKGSV